MRYLHTMLRVRNLDAALKFYRDALGLKEVRRIDNDKGRFTLVFLCSEQDLDLLGRTCRRLAARRWSSSPTTGTRRNTARTASSAISPMRSTTSTPPATS